ncbi:MAG: ThiF family adenylyltransferase, partial [Clostridia bacterium]|nr:ThiF family adenylyltransferase [Clostridia bacterium]
MERFSREITLIGENNFQKLSSATVAIFGVGGVGGYVCEALARCGISNFRIYDYDVVSISNINRQIIALDSTIGQKKVEVMKNRILDINPNSVVECFDVRVDQDNIESIDFSDVDYIVDAIDMVTSKVLLIEKTTKQNKKI